MTKQSIAKKREKALKEYENTVFMFVIVDWDKTARKGSNNRIIEKNKDTPTPKGGFEHIIMMPILEGALHKKAVARLMKDAYIFLTDNQKVELYYLHSENNYMGVLGEFIARALNIVTNKFTVSGHLIDQKLKHSYDTKIKQLSLFDTLMPQTKEKITEEEIIVEGIKLSEKEEQTLNGVLRLLYEKSDTKKDNGNKPSNIQTYFKGNLPGERLRYGGVYKEAPKIRFKPSELYEAILSNKAPSGFEISTIKKALESLENRKFLIAYNRKYRLGKEIKIDRIEEYQPLIKIHTYYKGLSQDELNKLEAGDKTVKKRKGEIILRVNPVFIDQVDTKFIEYPVDINKLTTIARGGGRVHTAITNLRDYLLRAISSQKKKNITEHTINKEKLYYQLGLEKYVKESRKKLIQQRVEEAIEVCKNLNLITETKEQTGVKGQAQIVFTLNLDY